MSHHRQNEVPLREIPYITGRAFLHAVPLILSSLLCNALYTKFPSDIESLNGHIWPNNMVPWCTIY